MRKILLCLLLSGCVASGPKIDASVASWQGASLDELISFFGYPVREVRLTSTTAYTFGASDTIAVPGSEQTVTETRRTITGLQTTTQTTGYPDQTIPIECWRTFEVDADHRVVRGSWQGNNCGARSRP